MSMFPIATANGSPSASGSFTFNSIPQTFTHLQIRIFHLSNANGGTLQFQFNGDTGSNYASHYLMGTGTVVAYNATTSSSNMKMFGYSTGTNTTYPTCMVFDLLDYTNTNKYKTAKAISGIDQNGSGEIELNSGLWMNTSAVTSITVLTNGGWYTNSKAQLYGIQSSPRTGA